MIEQGTFFTRIGRWFRRGDAITGEAPLIHPDDQAAADNGNPSTAIEPVQTARSTFLRPWAKRDQTLATLQEGFHTLTDLMGTIRDHLEKQSARQDELLGYLSHLPEALKQIPEGNRMQSEALRAIHQQMTQQTASSRQLGDILDRICDASNKQQNALDALNGRVENLGDHDKAIVDNLHNVGSAMEDVSRNSRTSTQVLENLRDNISSRDDQLERILLRQNTRFTWMLVTAIFLSIAALVAVSLIGYLMLYRPS